MFSAEESWRTAGRKVIEKKDKIQQQRDRQQEALNRRPMQKASQLDMGAFQTMCTVMADIARTSADQGLCRNEERVQLEAGMQQFHQLAQYLAQLQGRLQVQGQASPTLGGSSVPSMVQAYEARTTQQQVAANIV